MVLRIKMLVTGLTSQQGKTTKILITEVMAVELTSGKYITSSRAMWLSCPGGGGGLDSDARRKFWIKPLKEIDLGVAQAFFDPCLTPKRDEKIYIIYIFMFFRVQP